MVEKFGTNGGKIWYLTSVDLMRAHARAHAHSHTPQTHAHSVGMCLGFYRPQKVLSWAENQNFKVAPIFGTFAPFFHGVQYCTIGLEKPSAAARPRALKQIDKLQTEAYQRSIESSAYFSKFLLESIVPEFSQTETV